MRDAFSVGLVVLVLACDGSDTPPPMPDGGEPDTATPMTGMLPSGADLGLAAAAEPPALPTWTCPTGWSVVAPRSEGGAATCAPWAEANPAECGPGEARFPGDAACAPLYEACPSGSFPDAPAGPALYVDVASGAGGDGTRATPFASLDDALAAATAGTTVVLSTGVHRVSSATVPVGVTIRGACAASTLLRASATTPGVVLLDDAALEGLALATAGTGVEVRGTNAAIRGVEVREAATTGIIVKAGATLEGERTALRLGGSDAIDAGLWVERNTTVSFDGLRVDQARNRGINLGGMNAELTLRRGVIEDTRTRADGLGGFGAYVDGGRLTLVETVVARNQFGAVQAWNGAELRVEGSVFYDTIVNPNLGTAIVAADSELTVQQSGFERNSGFTVILQDGAHGVFEDVFFRDSMPLPEGHPEGQILGTALVVNEGCSAEGRRISAEESHNVAVTVYGGTATFEDLTILDTTHSPGDVDSGDGVFVGGGGDATFTRTRVWRAEQRGFWITDAESQATLYDVRVEDVSGRAWDLGRGDGIWIDEGANATGERIEVERVKEFGVLVGAGAQASLMDLTVRDVDGTVASEISETGIGVLTSLGGQLTATRVLVEGVHGVGMITVDTGTRGVLSDVTVRGTLPWGEDSIFGTTLGRGIEVQASAHVEITRALIEGNLEAGLLVATAGAVTLDDVIVEGTTHDPTGLSSLAVGGTLGGTITGQRVHIRQNDGEGLAAFGAGTRIELSDVQINATALKPCRETGCADRPGGTGALAIDGGAMRLTRFVIADSAVVGVIVAEGGQVDLSEGEIRGSPIGANVQSDGYDVGRLSDGVVYVGNDVNLSADTLPVPEAPDAVPRDESDTP